MFTLIFRVSARHPARARAHAATWLHVKSKFQPAEKRASVVVGTVTPFTSSNYCQAGARYRRRQLHDYIDEINDFASCCTRLPGVFQHESARVYPKSATKAICALQRRAKSGSLSLSLCRARAMYHIVLQSRTRWRNSKYESGKFGGK
jgi:hypothetical protein